MCESGGIGRRARLRISWLRLCGFDSRLSHLAPSSDGAFLLGAREQQTFVEHSTLLFIVLGYDIRACMATSLDTGTKAMKLRANNNPIDKESTCYTVSVLNSKAIQYRNRIKFLQATVPFARRFWSDSSEQLEEVYQHKMTDPIIARLVLLNAKL